MHDINGKMLSIGDEFTCYAYGLCKITGVDDEDNVEREGALIRAKSLKGDDLQLRTHIAKVVKVRTWKEIAADALAVQHGPSNLSGIVNSFSNTIREVKARMESEGGCSTDDLNHHPVCMLWSDKIASLTGTQNASTVEMMKAYDWAHNQKEGKS